MNDPVGTDTRENPSVSAAVRPSAPASASDRRAADRRSRSTPMISRFTILGGRRTGDRRSGGIASVYVDLYEPWLAAALVAIGALCAVDAVFTLLYLQKGGTEANPLMDRVIQWGPRSFILFKCGVTNLGLAVLCLHKNFRHVKSVIVALLFVYSALFVYHLYLAALI